MANIKITGLNELADPTLNDVFPIVNSGDTKKVKLLTVKETLGINNLDNVTKYLTAETVGDTSIFNININNPIVSGLILYIKFPNNSWTSNAILKINNNTTYNIQQNGSNIRGIDVSNKYLTIRYNGSNWQTENLNTRLAVAETSIGTLANLTTTEKTNLVGAINEVEARVDTAETDIDNLQTGWNSAGETWTYASVDDPTGVITISGDKTSKYSLGMRIKFTNATNVIYGIITAISYSSPNTTLTFLHEIDPTDSLALHLMANSAITSNYYSNAKYPYGFPTSCDSWSIIFSDSNYQIQNNPVQSTWYNLIGNINIPIGKWRVIYNCCIRGNSATATTIGLNTELSTSNNSSANAKSNAYVVGNSTVVAGNVFKEYIEELTSKTQYYFICRTATGSLTGLILMNDNNPLIIKATTCYL